MIKSILCLGDSNTYGVDPSTGSRFPREERWTGILQRILGDGYYVIEEGYNSRTTSFNDASDEMRSALRMIPFLLKTHRPIDLVRIMLGTNDLKTQYSVSAKVSAYAMKKLVESIRKWCRAEEVNIPQVLIISPIMIGEGIEESIYWENDKTSMLEAEKLPAEYERVADMLGCSFFHASSVAEPGEDSLHMTKDSHQRFAEAMAVEIRRILD